MEKGRLVLVHAAFVIAGWGIAAAVSSVKSRTDSESPGRGVETLPAKSSQVRTDVPGGRRIIARFVAAGLPEETKGWPSWEITSPKERLRLKQLAQGEAPLDDVAAERTLRPFMYMDLDFIVGGKGAPSFGYAFRHGRLGALEIRDQLSGQFPDYARRPDFDYAVCKALAPYNPVEIAPLVAALSSHYAEDVLNNIYSNGFGEIPPDVYARLMDSAKLADGMSTADLQRNWDQVMAHVFIPEYGTGLTGWLEGLPPGRQRDAALGALARRYQASNPEESARLRRLRTERTEAEGS